MQSTPRLRVLSDRIPRVLVFVYFCRGLSGNTEERPTCWYYIEISTHRAIFYHLEDSRSHGKEAEAERGIAATGSVRPTSEVDPHLELASGPNRIDPEQKRSKRVVTLSTSGDPRVDPATRLIAAAAHRRCHPPPPLPSLPPPPRPPPPSPPLPLPYPGCTTCLFCPSRIWRVAFSIRIAKEEEAEEQRRRLVLGGHVVRRRLLCG